MRKPKRFFLISMSTLVLSIGLLLPQHKLQHHSLRCDPAVDRRVCFDTTSIDRKTQDSGSIMKDIATVLRRLYRLYLHAYYQHFSVFGEVELQQHLYERFHRFVTTNRLLNEKDMKPFLSLDEVFAVIYNAMCECLYNTFSPFFVSWT